MLIFYSYLCLFSRSNCKEHVKTNHSHVGQIENKIQPVPYLSHIITHIVVIIMKLVLFCNYAKNTVYRFGTHMLC